MTDHSRYVVGCDEEAVDSVKSCGHCIKEIHLDGSEDTCDCILAMEMPDDEVDNLSERSDVRFVEEDVKLQAHSRSHDAPATTWGTERIGAEIAREQGYTGDGSSVAVIDSGIDTSHEAFIGDVFGEAFTPIPCDRDECDTLHDDILPHGTPVAGVVHQVAPDATIHPVRVLDDDGAYASDVVESLEWCVNMDIEVANISLGYWAALDVFTEGCQYAYDNGLLMAASSGNLGPCSEPCVELPANRETVIAVSATEVNDNVTRWSSTGDKIELTAPGEDIMAPVPGDNYRSYGGTSFSAPHVSGALAIVRAAGYSQETARELLRRRAVDIDEPQTHQGYGRLDLRRVCCND